MKARQKMLASSFITFAAASNMMAATVTTTMTRDSCGDNHPRGGDIEPFAANCSIGSLSQISKLGCYNSVCDELSDHEKCLAVIKNKFEHSPFREADNQALKVRLDLCLQTILPNLFDAIENTDSHIQP